MSEFQSHSSGLNHYMESSYGNSVSVNDRTDQGDKSKSDMDNHSVSDATDFTETPQHHQPKWRRIMFRDQPYEDCYVDGSFMSCLRTNEDVDNVPRFVELCIATFPIVQRIASVALWIAVFFLLLDTTQSSSSFSAESIANAGAKLATSALKRHASRKPSDIFVFRAGMRVEEAFVNIFVKPWIECPPPAHVQDVASLFDLSTQTFTISIPILLSTFHKSVCAIHDMVHSISISVLSLWYVTIFLAAVSFIGFMTSARLSCRKPPEKAVVIANSTDYRISSKQPLHEKKLCDPTTGMVDLSVGGRRKKQTSARSGRERAKKDAEPGSCIPFDYDDEDDYDPSDLRVWLFESSDLWRIISHSYYRVLTFSGLILVVSPIVSWFSFIPDGKIFALVTVCVVFHLSLHEYLPLSFRSQYEIVNNSATANPTSGSNSNSSSNSTASPSSTTKGDKLDNNLETVPNEVVYTTTSDPSPSSAVKTAPEMEELDPETSRNVVTKRKSSSAKPFKSKSRSKNSVAQSVSTRGRAWLRISANLMRDANTMFCEGSTYSAIAGSVFLSSRLGDVSAAAAFLAFSVVLFGLVPIALNVVRVRLQSAHIIVTIFLMICGWATIAACAPMLGGIYVFSLILVSCVSPQCFVYISRRKRVYHGPWDYYEEGEIGAENI